LSSRDTNITSGSYCITSPRVMLNVTARIIESYTNKKLTYFNKQ